MPQGRGSSRKKKGKARTRRANHPANAIATQNLEGTGPLQRDALERGADIVWPSSHDNWEDFDYAHLDILSGLAEAHGYSFIGAGSTRFVVRLTDKTIAKIAWTVSGLAQNLNSAAIWLGSPPEVRHRLAPCLAYTPTGVLVQQYVDGISPRSTRSSAVLSTEEQFGRAKASIKYLDEINALQAVFGNAPRTAEEVRLDNYGKSPKGHIVVVDYGHKPTDEPQTAWVLSRSTDQLLTLADAYPRYAQDIRLALERGPAGLDDFRLDSTIQELADRAGWPGPTDVCGNCDSGALFRECCGQIELRGLVAGV